LLGWFKLKTLFFLTVSFVHKSEVISIMFQNANSRQKQNCCRSS